ncbi:hypothetical protein A2U01_0014649 [Trifolium medium]|uniref:Uncharacterized protein n=1 Tax=Trifolium medium TaxID=97028 RepID=A0A392N1M0_9FABA|nr:hypothetical protein [Trifolium medium]
MDPSIAFKSHINENRFDHFNNVFDDFHCVSLNKYLDQIVEQRKFIVDVVDVILSTTALTPLSPQSSLASAIVESSLK